MGMSFSNNCLFFWQKHACAYCGSVIEGTSMFRYEHKALCSDTCFSAWVRYSTKRENDRKLKEKACYIDINTTTFT